MTSPIRVTLCTSLLSILASATAVSGQEVIRHRGGHGSLEVSFRDRTATLISPSGDVARASLSEHELAGLRLGVADASRVGARQSSPSELSTWDRVQGRIYFDPFAPIVNTDLLARLAPLRTALSRPPQDTRVVSIGVQEEAEPSYPTRSLTVRRRGKTELTYALGDLTWTLPRPRLSRRQRARIRRAVRVLEGKAALDPATGLPEVPLMTPWVRLKVEGRSWSREYENLRVGFFPRRAVKLGQALEQILNQVYRYDERRLTGQVVGDRIRCGGLQVEVQRPLRSLLPKLQGRTVRINALVRRDGKWAVTLYLLAHDGEGGVLPVQGPGPQSGTLLSAAWSVRPSIPPGTRRLRRRDRTPRVWPEQELQLSWETTQQTKSAAKNETKGVVGGLKRGAGER